MQYADIAAPIRSSASFSRRTGAEGFRITSFARLSDRKPLKEVPHLPIRRPF